MFADTSLDTAVGRKFTKALQNQCAKLARLPGMLGRLRPELGANLRSFPYKGYIIFFRHRGDLLEIVNILGAHRDLPPLFTKPDR
jgi:plasmid stabilization system protein ParE